MPHVYESRDEQNNIRSRVYESMGGTFDVRTVDDDSGQPIEIRKRFLSADDAIKHANKMTGKGSEIR